MNFPYPGDDPAALSSAAWAIERAGQQLDAFNRTVLASQSSLVDVWEGEVAERVASDLGKMAVAVPQLQAKLAEARRALDGYRLALMDVRAEVDSLRKQHQNISEVLAGEDYEYRNAGSRYDPSGTGAGDLDSYRAGLAESREQTVRRLEQLTDMYDALVVRAVQAAELCSATIRLDSLAPGAPGQGRTSLTKGYGLDQFSVAHLEAMRSEATEFVKAGEQARSTLPGPMQGSEMQASEMQASEMQASEMQASEMQGSDLVSSLSQRYGENLADPDFLTAVIELGGAEQLAQVRAQSS